MHSKKETSTWERDLANEHEFSKFLDKFAYRPLEQVVLYHDGSHPEFDRISEIGLQMSGVDVILKEHDNTLFLDEKSQLNNINEKIPTFCLELSYQKDDIVEAGWFLNHRKITQAYMFCWPFQDEQSKLENKAFSGARMLLVSKYRIIRVLDAYGYNNDVLAQRDELIRKNGKYSTYHTVNPDFWFSLSKKGPEHPVNLIVRATLLKSLSLADLHIFRNQNEILLEGNWVGQPIKVKMNQSGEILN